MALTDDDPTTFLWLAEAQAQTPYTAPRILCQLIANAIANKDLNWSGPPGWTRPDHVNFDDPETWRRARWLPSKSLVKLPHREGDRFYIFRLRIGRNFLQVIGLTPVTEQVPDPASPPVETTVPLSTQEEEETETLQLPLVVIAPPPERQRRQQASREVDRILPVLRELYPPKLYPKGAPKTYETVRGKVNAELARGHERLAEECRQRGDRVPEAPAPVEWDSTKRAVLKHREERAQALASSRS